MSLCSFPKQGYGELLACWRDAVAANFESDFDGMTVFNDFLGGAVLIGDFPLDTSLGLGFGGELRFLLVLSSLGVEKVTSKGGLPLDYCGMVYLEVSLRLILRGLVSTGSFPYDLDLSFPVMLG